MQNGEPVIDLVDAAGNVQPCLYSRVAWARAHFGYTVKDEKELANAAKMISGLAEPGEKLKPSPVGEPAPPPPRTAKGKGKTAKPQKLDEDEEPESTDVQAIPIG